MNKTTAFLLVVITALSFILGSTMQGNAQNKGFSGIVPFSTTTDRLGFLDQNTGRIYVYENNYSQCVFIGQLQGLGQAIQTVSRSQ
jgi:hypothetical protein